MANVYVRSGATGAGTGADWANAYTTLQAALLAKAAGDSYWVSEDHAQTQASALAVASHGTPATPSQIVCVDHAGSVPPVSADRRATATVSTTGANNISLQGSFYCEGVTFSAGSSTSVARIDVAASMTDCQRYKNCKFVLNNSGATSKINMPVSLTGAGVDLENCTFTFGATGQTIYCQGNLRWRDTASAIVGATIPTALFTTFAASGCTLTVSGVDLSALGSGTTLIIPANTVSGYALFENCKLGASVAVAAALPNAWSTQVDIERCDSGATNYRTESYRYQGVETTETTIVRTGGASDGTTPASRKIVTTANAKPLFPFEMTPLDIWNDTAGSSVTVTVEGIWGGGSVPNNDDIWMEVSYLGSSSFPIDSFATCGKADALATGTGLSTSTEAWGGSTTKFKMAVTITPQMKGPITCTVKAGKASSTFYIDPKVTLT